MKGFTVIPTTTKKPSNTKKVAIKNLWEIFYRLFPVSCVFMNTKQGYLYISQIAT